MERPPPYGEGAKGAVRFPGLFRHLLEDCREPLLLLVSWSGSIGDLDARQEQGTLGLHNSEFRKLRSAIRDNIAGRSDHA